MMTERVEEIRRLITSHARDPKNTSVYLHAAVELLAALAQAERERDELHQEKDGYVLEARHFERKYDEARAEVERLKVALDIPKDYCIVSRARWDNREKIAADLARVRKAATEYLTAMEALALEDSGGLGGNTQEDFDRANRAADTLRAALEGRG